MFFLDFLGGVILHWNLITSKNQFTNKKSQRKVATIRKNDAFCSCLGINYYTLRPQLGHVHTFDWNANIFVPCASFRYNFGELSFKIELKNSPSLNFQSCIRGFWWYGISVFGLFRQPVQYRKKGSGPIMSNFLGWFFKVFRVKKLKFF